LLSVLWFSETLDEYNKMCSYLLNAVIRAIYQQSNTSQIILLFDAIELFDRRNVRICFPTSTYFPNIDSMESALPCTLLHLTVPSETLLFVLEVARFSRHYHILYMENGLNMRSRQIRATFLALVFALFAVTTFTTGYQMFDGIY